MPVHNMSTITEATEELRAKAASVARTLPGGPWRLEFENVNGSARINGPNGQRIFFDHDNRTGRIEVHGSWPRDCYGRVQTPQERKRITFDGSRSSAEWKAEVERRFLTWYLLAYGKAKETCDRLAEHHAAQQATRARLAAIVEAHIVGHSPESASIYRNQKDSPNENVYGEIKVNSADSVQIELRGLTEAQAAELLRVLAKHLAPKKTRR